MKWMLWLLMLGLSWTVSAQEIESTVTINSDALPSGTDKDNIANLARDLQNYINSYRWTGEEFKGPKIKVTLSIQLQTASNGVYTAQAFVASQRPIYKSNDMSPMVRILDNAWQFNYAKDQSLYHDEFHFNALTGFVDYYMYVVLGFDYDSYDPLGGSKFFQRASNIVAQGQNGDYPTGWQPGGSGTYSRNALAADVLSGKYEEFRKAFCDYEYNGIDLFSTQKDTAQAAVAAALNKITDVVIQNGSRSALAKVFFDAKYSEIADALRDYPDKGILQKLSVADQSHQSTYLKYVN